MTAKMKTDFLNTESNQTINTSMEYKISSMIEEKEEDDGYMTPEPSLPGFSINGEISNKYNIITLKAPKRRKTTKFKWKRTPKRSEPINLFLSHPIIDFTK